MLRTCSVLRCLGLDNDLGPLPVRRHATKKRGFESYPPGARSRWADDGCESCSCGLPHYLYRDPRVRRAGRQ